MRVSVINSRGFPSFMLKSLLIFMIVVFGFVLFTICDDDGYIQLVGNVSAASKTTSKIVTTALEATKSITKGNSSSDTSGSSGVNLNLIDRIKVNTPKKGYIKEYLSLLRDNQQGKLNSGVDTGYPLTSFISMHKNEIGFDNDGCPDFYFTPGSWQENSKNNSFAGFTSNSKKSRDSDSSSGVGPLQWIKAGGKFDFKSIRNPANNTRGDDGFGGKGDVRYLPDTLGYMTSLYTPLSKEYKGANSNAIGMLASLCNNRGYIQPLMLGYAYMSGTNESIRAWKSVDKKTKKSILDAIYEPFDKLSKKGKSINVSQSYCGAVAAVVNSDSAGRWFINNTAYNFLVGNGYVSDYKKLYGSKKSDSAIKAELKEHVVNSLADSIKIATGVRVTSNDTKTVYYTSSDYQDCAYYTSHGGPSNYGYVWYVSDIRDKNRAYKTTSNYKQPFHVVSFDGVSFRYAFDTSGVAGPYLYADLLKKAGVNEVDPTDVKTYMNQYFIGGQTNNTYDPSSVSSGSLEDLAKSTLIKPSLVNFDSLSDDRKKVLRNAMEMTKSKQYVYDWGGRSTNKENNYAKKLTSYHNVSSHSLSRAQNWYRKLKYPKYGVDCSGFIYACYNLSGYKVAYCACRGGLKNGTADWKKISRDELKPGDILATGSHVVMYFAKMDGKILTIEAGSSGTYVQSYYSSKMYNAQPLRYTGFND